MLGCFPIPCHANFDEVNLRFYIRHREGNEDRRGVVFISEVVPRRAIAATARFLYGENYTCLPMRHHVETEELGKTFEYQWKVDGKWSRLSAQTSGVPTHPSERSLEQFITDTTGLFEATSRRLSRISRRTRSVASVGDN